MSVKIKFLNKIIAILLLVWSLMILMVTYVVIHENYSYANKLVKQEALINIKKDLAYRSWGSSHGGVYVPITKRTPPNPYLAHLKNRDVVTNDNQKLTLMNPAYMITEMMKDYSELYGLKGHITSLKLTNPKNKPDEWEYKALKEIDKHKKPISEKTFIKGKEYFRYINPLVTEESCLKCHSYQGYKVGDIRGAVSIAIPMKGYYKEAYKLSLMNGIIAFFVWLIGLSVILLGGKKAKDIIDEKLKYYEQNIYSLVNIVERRDSYTAGHSTRIAEYSVLIAKQMNFTRSDIDDLYRAGMLHDIGKVAIPDSILLKPGKLSELEYKIIQSHVVVSYEILNNIDIYKDIAEIVRHHHEHFNGLGYPQGLKGDQTPILSQIMTLADAFDAMTTNRIYKARKTVDTALEELKLLSGKQFNVFVVDAALIVLKNIYIDENINQRPNTEIEKERFAYFYKDQLTKTYNRDYLEFILSYKHSDTYYVKYMSGVYLHHFSQYNTTNGWANGDKLLAQIADKLNELSGDDYVFRIHGDDFLILSTNYFDMSSYADTFDKILKDACVKISCKEFTLDESIKNLDDLEKIF